MKAVGALGVALALVVGSCADGAGPADAEDTRLRVISTVAPITNIVANVAGDLVEITGVVPQGADSHEFDPPPSVARILASADLVFLNGLNLEVPTYRMAEANLKEGAEIVELGDRTIMPDEWIFDFSFPESDGDPNPHLWMNPLYGKRYAEVVRDELSRRDPDNAQAYEENYESFAARINAFDEALREATATVPSEQRKLLTYHDSFPYFAREYDWDIIGAIQPSDFSDPSPREVANIIEQVREEQIRAVFGSEVFPSPVLEQIARETQANYVDDLYDDELPGEPGDPNHTYLGMLAFNYGTVVDALGGDAEALRAVDVTNVAPDGARYL